MEDNYQRGINNQSLPQVSPQVVSSPQQIQYQPLSGMAAIQAFQYNPKIFSTVRDFVPLDNSSFSKYNGLDYVEVIQQQESREMTVTVDILSVEPNSEQQMKELPPLDEKQVNEEEPFWVSIWGVADEVDTPISEGGESFRTSVRGVESLPSENYKSNVATSAIMDQGQISLLEDLIQLALNRDSRNG
eukprot:TRINITY_DN5528_c0_g2_i3.p2 TRINITY_DN5528_c0_g2~~TRINITY_DN5528_c0_g2_i3.p2  ORF type:complete len:188 (+),score=18.60 TRINITY_DN5528_c0_g2_i3:342-905(+)